MNHKNRSIIILFAIGLFLIAVIQFVIIPGNTKRREEYLKNQDDSLTHDILNVMDYQSRYIGDSSNTINLFYHLPLNSISMKFHIYPKDCSLTVYYLDTVENIGEDKVHRDLLYNSVAAMALINNLTKVTYEWSGDKFVFTREQLETEYGKNLAALLPENIWKSKIQNKLNDTEYVDRMYKKH